MSITENAQDNGNDGNDKMQIVVDSFILCISYPLELFVYILKEEDLFKYVSVSLITYLNIKLVF